MFKKLFNNLNTIVDKVIDDIGGAGLSQKTSLENKLFKDVVGYDDLKVILGKAIVSKEQIHILLTGPPATSKTVFLLSMLDNLKNVHYIDGSATSGAGMIDYLFDHPELEYLLIDEVDKLNAKDQTVLYNVMETGILTETKSSRTKGSRQQKMHLKIFATGNEIYRLKRPFRSRFLEFALPEYTYTEFTEIAVKLLGRRFKLNPDIALEIARVVWYETKTKDIRDMLDIAKLVRNVEEVKTIAKTLVKYMAKDEYKNED